jgi:hypothetical protein
MPFIVVAIPSLHVTPSTMEIEEEERATARVQFF